jgi:hypothetical protein
MLQRIDDFDTQYCILFQVRSHPHTSIYNGIALATATVQDVINCAEYAFGTKVDRMFLDVRGNLEAGEVTLITDEDVLPEFRDMGDNTYELHLFTPLAELSSMRATNEYGYVAFQFQLSNAVISDLDLLALRQRIVAAAQTTDVHENVVCIRADMRIYIAREGSTVQDLLLETRHGACELLHIKTLRQNFPVRFEEHERLCRIGSDGVITIGYKTPLHLIRDNNLLYVSSIFFGFADRKRGETKRLQLVPADTVKVSVCLIGEIGAHTFIAPASTTLGAFTRLAQDIWMQAGNTGWVSLHHTQNRTFAFVNRAIVSAGGKTRSKGKREVIDRRLRHIRPDERAYNLFAAAREFMQQLRRYQRALRRQGAGGGGGGGAEDGDYEDNGFRPELDPTLTAPDVGDFTPVAEEAMPDETANTPVGVLLQYGALNEVGVIPLYFTTHHHVPPAYMQDAGADASYGAEIRKVPHDAMLVNISDNVYLSRNAKVVDVLYIANRAGCEIAGMQIIHSSIKHVRFHKDETLCKLQYALNGAQSYSIGFETPLALFFMHRMHDDYGRLSFKFFPRTDVDENDDYAV